MIEYNKKLTPLTRTLRKNMTAEERHLWYDFLKKLPFTVHRQKNIHNYIVDFYIADKKLVIEIDGRQHRLPQHIESDNIRDNELALIGIRVIRYSNNDINNNFDSVVNDILHYLDLSILDLK
jgi:very-short-patch-repair endonuclease